MIATNAAVFVVDDDAAMRDSLRDLIRSVGLRVEIFDSAQDMNCCRCPASEENVSFHFRRAGQSVAHTECCAFPVVKDGVRKVVFGRQPALVALVEAFANSRSSPTNRWRLQNDSGETAPCRGSMQPLFPRSPKRIQVRLKITPVASSILGFARCHSTPRAAPGARVPSTA